MAIQQTVPQATAPTHTYDEGSWSAATAINVAMALEPETRENRLLKFDLFFLAELYDHALDAADVLVERDTRDAMAQIGGDHPSIAARMARGSDGQSDCARSRCSARRRERTAREAAGNSGNGDLGSAIRGF
jgi:hypothetical protein